MSRRTRSVLPVVVAAVLAATLTAVAQRPRDPGPAANEPRVLSGPDVWGPMALSDGTLVVRDLAKMVALDVRGR